MDNQRERRRAYARQYYRDHRLQIMEYQRHWRAANREYVRQYQREWRENQKYLKKMEGNNQ